MRRPITLDHYTALKVGELFDKMPSGLLGGIPFVIVEHYWNTLPIHVKLQILNTQDVILVKRPWSDEEKLYGTYNGK